MHQRLSQPEENRESYLHIPLRFQRDTLEYMHEYCEVSGCSLHLTYHNMHRHVRPEDLLRSLLQLPQTFSVHRNVLRAMSRKSPVRSFQGKRKVHYSLLP